MEKKRSVGITVLSTIFISIGLLNLILTPQYINDTKKFPRHYTLEEYKKMDAPHFKKISKEREFIEFMDSAQGKAMMDETNEFLANSLLSLAGIYAPTIGRLSWVILLVLGIGLLRLKEWGRKATIIIGRLEIPIIFGWLYFPLLAAHRMKNISLKYGYYDIVPNVNAASIREELLTSSIALSLYMLSVFIIVLGIIYYLTRPKVKEQFR